jgi:hypothetical protein
MTRRALTFPFDRDIIVFQCPPSHIGGSRLLSTKKMDPCLLIEGGSHLYDLAGIGKRWYPYRKGMSALYECSKATQKMPLLPIQRRTKLCYSNVKSEKLNYQPLDMYLHCIPTCDISSECNYLEADNSIFHSSHLSSRKSYRWLPPSINKENGSMLA